MAHVESTEFPNFAKKADIVEAGAEMAASPGNMQSFLQRLVNTDLNLLADKAETTAASLIPTSGATLGWV